MKNIKNVNPFTTCTIILLIALGTSATTSFCMGKKHKKPSRENILTEQNSPAEAVLRACFSKDLENLKEIINNPKINLNTPEKKGDLNGITPLSLAVQGCNFEVTKLLVDKILSTNNKNFNIPNIPSGRTPLICACNNKNKKIVEFLVEELIKIGEDFNAPIEPGYKEEGNTPLLAAILIDNIDAVKFLIQKMDEFGKDLEAPIKYGKDKGLTYFFAACAYGSFKSTKFILERLSKDKKINLNSPCQAYSLFGFTPMEIACIKGNLDIVKLLIDYAGKDFNVKLTEGKCSYSSLFLTASFKGHLNIIAFLHDKIEKDFNLTIEFDPNDYSSPLLNACQEKKLGVIEFITERIKNPTEFFTSPIRSNLVKNQTLLEQIILKEYLPAIAYLIQKLKINTKTLEKKHQDIIEKALKCFYHRCETKDFNEIENLIKNKKIKELDITTQNGEGQTPLLMILNAGEFDLAETLIKKIETETKDYNALEKLKTLESIFDTPNLYGQTPLSIAIIKKKWDLAKKIISQMSTLPIQISIKNEKISSYLELAIINNCNDGEIIKRLIPIDDPSYSNKTILNAVYLSILNNNHICLRALIKALGKTKEIKDIFELVKKNNSEFKESNEILKLIPINSNDIELVEKKQFEQENQNKEIFDCPICKNTIKKNDSVYLCKQCNKPTCYECITQWLLKNPNKNIGCPLCRNQIL